MCPLFSVMKQLIYTYICVYREEKEEVGKESDREESRGEEREKSFWLKSIKIVKLLFETFF